MIFAIYVPPDEEELLQTNLVASYPDKHLQAASGLWFVALPLGTAKDVSDKIGLTEGKIKSGLVTSIGGYYGRLSPYVWEWLVKNWQ
ncbi:hypothetical protein [Candidatus Binatus sp.]|uniref:hypothetical protein n=1 Tax=Candidatus Binatus sp. TaxID=2811406 RepID=UPI003F99C93B